MEWLIRKYDQHQRNWMAPPGADSLGWRARFDHGNDYQADQMKNEEHAFSLSSSDDDEWTQNSLSRSEVITINRSWVIENYAIGMWSKQRWSNFENDHFWRHIFHKGFLSIFIRTGIMIIAVKHSLKLF